MIEFRGAENRLTHKNEGTNLMRFILRIRVAALSAFAMATTVAAPGFASERHYAIFDVGSLQPQSPSTTVWGINESTIIVGGSDVGSQQRPFVRSDGSMVELPTLGGAWGRARAVNESGVVVGWSTPFGTGMDPQAATLWRDGKMIALPTLDSSGSVAWDINDLGVIVGESRYDPKSFLEHAVKWESGGLFDLSQSPGARYDSHAYAINNDGWIVGYAVHDAIIDQRARLWLDGKEIDLGDLGGADSFAYDVNDLGQIVGVADRPGFDDSALFGWEDGIMYDLGGIPGYDGFLPYTINNVGEIVGRTVEPDTFNLFATFWSHDLGPVLVQDLLPIRTGVTMEIALDINDRGQFVGWGYTDDRFSNEGFLVSPVTPTMTFAPADGTRIVAGANNELIITDAPPNTTVYLLWSNRGGGTEIPGCDLLDNAVQLAKPRTFATVTTDASGSATYVGFVPARAAGKTVLLQAVAPETCAISTLRVETVQ